eukprot:gene26824-biopygen17413
MSRGGCSQPESS